MLKAYYLTEDYSRDGVPLWWDESDVVAFEVEKRISKSRAAIQRAEDAENSKDKKSPPGRYYIPVPKKIGGGPLPTFNDFIAQQEHKKGKK